MVAIRCMWLQMIVAFVFRMTQIECALIVIGCDHHRSGLTCYCPSHVGWGRAVSLFVVVSAAPGRPAVLVFWVRVGWVVDPVPLSPAAGRPAGRLSAAFVPSPLAVTPVDTAAWGVVALVGCKKREEGACNFFLVKQVNSNCSLPPPFYLWKAGKI